MLTQWLPASDAVFGCFPLKPLMLVPFAGKPQLLETCSASSWKAVRCRMCTIIRHVLFPSDLPCFYIFGCANFRACWSSQFFQFVVIYEVPRTS